MSVQRNYVPNRESRTYNPARSSSSRPPSYFSGSPPSALNHFKAANHIEWVFVIIISYCWCQVRTGESGDAIFMSKRLANTVGVHFRNNHLVLYVREGITKLFVHRRKFLCMHNVLVCRIIAIALCDECRLPCSDRTRAQSCFVVNNMDTDTKQSTYNSTSAGFPWPMMLSKLSGFSSTTFEAKAVANEVATAKSEKVNFIFSTTYREDGGCRESDETVRLWSRCLCEL